MSSPPTRRRDRLLVGTCNHVVDDSLLEVIAKHEQHVGKQKSALTNGAVRFDPEIPLQKVGEHNAAARATQHKLHERRAFEIALVRQRLHELQQVEAKLVVGGGLEALDGVAAHRLVRKRL
jgi:hypothetical protein